MMEVWVIEYVSPNYGSPHHFHSICETEELAKEYVKRLNDEDDFGHFVYFRYEVRRCS
jgi:hypothetical protein